MTSSMMILVSVLSTVCLLLLTNTANTSVVNEQFWHLQAITDFASGKHLFTASALTASACGHLCKGFPTCQSFAFNSGTHTCWLYDRLVQYTTNGTAAPGTRYFWRLSPRCPPELGYTLEEGLCFKVHRVNMTFPVARDVCAGEGGTLFITDTVAKVDLLKNRVTKETWVGASDLEVEGDWRWEDGRKIDVTSPIWIPGRPDDSGGVQDAAYVQATGRLDDAAPWARFHAACQLLVL